MKKCSFYCFAGCLLFPVMAVSQSKTDEWLKDLLWQNASPQLKNIFEHPNTFHYQIIYTKIDRNKNNKPRLTNYYYRFDKEEYFNPASTVKMPLAFLALEKINSLKKYGVDKNASMFTDSAYSGQTSVVADTSSANGLPSIANYIKKIFLVSDNDAYNRLYEFIGQQEINKRLWQMGYKDARITRRFVRTSEEENRHSNPVRFADSSRSLYEQPAAYSNIVFDFNKKILVGKAHYDNDDKLVNEPMDFTRANNISLEGLQQILQAVLFPNSVSKKQRFLLTKEDYAFLYQYMSEYPYESHFPNYDTAEYFQSYCKFFMFKSGRGSIPPYIRVFNKPGWTYGYLTDVAYIVDFKNNIEFMLSGTIYVNSDGILNDDKYDYDEIGYPFFKEVGNIIYNYESGRSRKRIPDLKKFQLNYGQ